MTRVTQPLSGRARIEPGSPDCQAQGSLFSTLGSLPWGLHTSVSEQRWEDLQVSLLPEPRAVFLYVQLKEALPRPPLSFQHVCYQHPNMGCQARGFRGPEGWYKTPRSGRWKLGADRHRFVLNPCLTARWERLKFQPLHYPSPVPHIFQPRNAAREKT